MKQIKSLAENIFYPFGKLDIKIKVIVIAVQILLILTYMQLSNSSAIPKPLLVLSTVADLLTSSEFYDDFIATFLFVMKGMGYAMILTMLLTYLRPILFFTHLVDFVTKCRYLTLNTVLIMFTMMVAGGNLTDLKMLLLLFGTVPFFVNSFVYETAIGLGIPEYHLNKAFVNKLNKWEALLQVIIIGKLDRLFLVVKSNFGIVWAVVTAVEANAMSEGGIGTLISKANKHVVVSELVAIALVVLLIGVFFDWGYGKLRWVFFAYTRNR